MYRTYLTCTRHCKPIWNSLVCTPATPSIICHVLLRALPKRGKKQPDCSHCTDTPQNKDVKDSGKPKFPSPSLPFHRYLLILGLFLSHPQRTFFCWNEIESCWCSRAQWVLWDGSRRCDWFSFITSSYLLRQPAGTERFCGGMEHLGLCFTVGDCACS